MIDIINCTPHKLVIYESEDVPPMVTIEPSGIVARLSVESKQVAELDGIPVFKTIFGEPSDLPPSQSNVIFVTSMLYAKNCDRKDVYYPGEAIRDEDGNIVGCIGLTHP